MKFAGSYKLNVKKEIVWRALNDSDILKQCIPGCESFEKESDTIFNATATNQIGPMNATFSGKVTLSNIQENQSYTLSGEGQSSVGFANGSADVKIKEENGSTTLSYEVNINVGGKVAQLGSRLIDGIAKKMSDYFFGRFSDLVSPIKKEENGSTTLSYVVNANVGGKVAQLGSRLMDGVAKKMSDYFFGRFSDLVAPIKKEKKDTGEIVEEKRVVELKSNFLNKYIYFALATLILLLVVIFYFVSR